MALMPHENLSIEEREVRPNHRGCIAVRLVKDGVVDMRRCLLWLSILCFTCRLPMIIVATAVSGNARFLCQV